MRVTTYYCTYNNFGDNLNIDIFKKYGLKVISSRFEESSIIGIGTLLNKTLFTNKSNCLKSDFHITRQMMESHPEYSIY